MPSIVLLKEEELKKAHFSPLALGCIERMSINNLLKLLTI